MSDDDKSGIFESLLSSSGGRFTNSFVTECFNTVFSNNNLSFEDLLHFLQTKGACGNISKDSLRSKLERNRIKVNKLRGKKREEFLAEPFKFPVPNIQDSEAQLEVRSVLPVASSSTSYEHDLESRLLELKKENKEIKLEKKTLKRKLKRQDTSTEGLKEKVRKLLHENTKLESEVKKSRKVHAAQSKSILALHSINRTHKLAMKSYKDKVQSNDKKLLLEQTKSALITEKLNEAEGKVAEADKEKQNLTDFINKLKSENKELHESIDYCELLLNDANELSLYNDKGHLTNEAEMCIMNLLSAKVGINNVGNVLKAVFKLHGKEIPQLPDEKTIRNINDRMLALSLKQISEEFVEKDDTTLYTDETTKLGKKISGYHASDREGNFWVLGLRELSNKSSQMTLDVFKQILDDIDEASKKISPEDTETHSGHTLLSKVKNTMSDRAATEVAFNELLQDYRTQILPDVVDNWRDLDNSAKDAMSRMNNFFCGLHLLVGFAETTEKVLLKYEQANYENPFGAAANPQTKRFAKTTESGVARTVRTTAKALARGADEKSGCYRAFKNYLDEVNKKEKLEKYLGNRFNILFHDAEVLFYLQEDIENFLENIHGASNLLLQGVLSDVKEEKNIAGCKSLGLCSKLVTAPFWRLIESKGNILDMNDYYMNLMCFLEEASKDPTDFMTGKSTPFPELVNKDHIYEKLIKSDEKLDPIVHSLIILIFTAWHSYLKRSVKDHLPEGKYSLSSDKLKAECQSAARHNKFPERVFGLTDSLMRHRPNASEMCNEAFIMFTNNKTCAWIEAKSEDEKAALLKDAHKFGKHLRKQFQNRTKEIAHQRMNSLRMKQQRKEEKEAKKLKEKEKLTDEIIYYGLWQNKETVKRKLNEIKTASEKEKALKIQLKFRREILQQTSSDSNVYKFSKDKKKLTIEQLKINLESLIVHAFEIEQSEASTSSKPDVPLLQGRTVKHCLLENNIKTWYKGYVISTVPGFRNFYNIIYDNDENVYTYKLMEDYANGDLEIIVD